MKEQSPQPAHWSKDFVEHVRTVHFTLMGVCVGLIVLSLFPSKTEIQLAHEQASEILDVINRWNPQFLGQPAKDTALRVNSNGTPGAGQPLLGTISLSARRPSYALATAIGLGYIVVST